MQNSKALFARAQQTIPGGVNSPVRAFKAVGGDPIFFKSAKGAWLTSADNKKYIDYIASWGPMILGHGHPQVVEAVQQQAAKAFSFGAPTELEVQMAKLMTTMVPGLEKVRMVNSGTEACMSALRLARGYTGRKKVLKFEGCYHGHADSFLIKAGSGASTFGTPNSPGVTQGTTADTLLAPYNNLQAVTQIFEQNPNQIAAVFIEPVAGNMGCIIPKAGFMEGLRKLCTDHGALLVFDEVMTGFRLAPGGAQQHLGITADLVTYGKVIGGGMPVGAYGGSAQIMAHLSPDGPVYQAGTLSGNPLAMAAGLATLTVLNDNPHFYTELNNIGTELAKLLKEPLNKKGIPYQINQLGSMISLHFTDTPVVDFETSAKANNAGFKAYFNAMLQEGVYLPPSAFESWFLNIALGEAELELTQNAHIKALEQL